MRTKKVLAAVAIALACVGAHAQQTSGAPDGEVVKAAVAALAPRPEWKNVTIDRRESNALSLTIHYKVFPSEGLATSEADTEALVVAVAQGLAKAGHSPAKENRMIFVSATRDVLGVTGEKRVQFLGMAIYRPDQDGVSFKPTL
ncbi:hypothetical protein [Paraburkholderia acidiphila]|uniref:Uncharacterized protein n=1 Tax=Paraburkholderia acidiphila TaxID=2571747 RepID=A0A7Z2G7Y9_9BURK|nr:hypothetical protein [Paraburkholderia acidiphila]QGZ56717.1 hypothetical protein FAZ97_17280 [Paraburkholderia acidiphila]